MNISADDFRRHFEVLSDAALLGTNRDELTAAAQVCFDEEVTRRGLDRPEAAAEALAEVRPQEAAEGDPMVVIASYSIAEEASLARGLMASAEIPCRLASEYVAMGPSDIRLLVPQSFVEQALEILDHEISDEELAAQAEAAWNPEFDEEEFDEDEEEELADEELDEDAGEPEAD